MEGKILVKCGLVDAWLHQDKFICPGIHAECIEVADGRLVSPKTFSVMGEKEKLKDWKNAVRLNGVSVRKMMDSGKLDFHDHKNNCTGKCVSRNSGVTKQESVWPEGDVSFTTSPFTPEKAMALKEKLSGSDVVLPCPALLSQSSLLDVYNNINGLVNGNKAHQVQNGLEQPLAYTGHPLVQHAKITPPSNGKIPVKTATEEDVKPDITKHGDSTIEKLLIVDDMMEDSQDFWRGIMDVGLLDVFFREIKMSLDMVKNDLIRSQCSSEDAAKISSVVMRLGLMTKLKWKLATHKTEMDNQNKQLVTEMQALKRKMEEAQRKQLALKRKSTYFSQLLEKGQSYSPQPEHVMPQDLSMRTLRSDPRSLSPSPSRDGSLSPSSSHSSLVEGPLQLTPGALTPPLQLLHSTLISPSSSAKKRKMTTPSKRPSPTIAKICS